MAGFDYTAALKGSDYARENEKTDKQVLRRVQVPSITARIAREFEVSEDDPRVQEMLNKITAKGYDPSQWLDFASGKSDKAPARQAGSTGPLVRRSPFDSRAPLPEGNNPEGPEAPPSEGAITNNPVNVPALAKKGYALADLAATRAADAATAGLWSKGMQAGKNAISPGSGDAYTQAQAALEAPTGPGIKDTTVGQQVGALGRAAGYLSPVGVPAMIGKVAGKVIPQAAGRLPEAVRNITTSRPVLGAATGAATGAGVGASEAVTERGDIGQAIADRTLTAGQLGEAAADVGRAALGGAAFGGAVGGGAGALSAGVSKLGRGASKRIDDRFVSDMSEGAPAGKRDKLLGRAGEKADRIVETGRRDPELRQAAADPQKSLPVLENRIDSTGARLDAVYHGSKSMPDAVATRIEDMAADLFQNPATRSMAEEMLVAADRARSAWGNGPIDTRQVRQFATDLGKNLFKGNPNADRTLSQQVRQKLYGELTEQIAADVERVKPGVRPELEQLNADMSDYLNMRSAVTSRASRQASPSNTLRARADQVMDWGLGLLHPGAFLAKKGLQKFGPGTMRIVDEELSATTPRSGQIESNPLIRALESERERDRRRANTIRRAQ